MRAIGRWIEWTLAVFLPELIQLVSDALHWLFVTLPTAIWNAFTDMVRWLFVTLPREIARAIRSAVHWLFVTLPTALWRGVVDVGRFVLEATLMVWDEVTAVLRTTWEVVSEALTWALAIAMTPLTSIWLLLRSLVDTGGQGPPPYVPPDPPRRRVRSVYQEERRLALRRGHRV